MNYISKIAFNRNIRNETPNKELAEELANSDNSVGIREISEYLFDKNKSVSSDCLAVLYTIGYSKPELIQEYTSIFLKLLESKINRMVWGSMIALSTVARLKASEIFNRIDFILETMKNGTLITEIWGIVTLVNLSLSNKTYKNKLLPVLFEYMENCRPVDFAKRVETILPVIEGLEEKEIIDNIIKAKKNELSNSQIKKLMAILKRN